VFPDPELAPVPPSVSLFAVNSAPHAASAPADKSPASVRFKLKDMADDSFLHSFQQAMRIRDRARKGARDFAQYSPKSRIVASACAREATPSLRKIRWT
jgi:hypothetical protein